MQPMPEAGQKRPIAIIGSGSIGTAFAVVFATAGYDVRIQDPDPERREAAMVTLRARLAELIDYGIVEGNVEAIAARVAMVTEPGEAVAGVSYVQECVPEDLEVKRRVFSELDALTPGDAVIASSSSAIVASQSAGHVPGRARFLVCHPANPPFLLRVIELVPAPFTSAQAVEKARELLAASGFQPVVVRKEVEGFALNRLQGAILREAYCLVRDGVVSADEVDQLVRDGLGLRWSFMGPFETVDLNTRGGLASHAVKMGPAYERMGAERGQHDPWTPDLVAKVVAERRSRLPLEKWEERGAWRDRRLMALIRHRREQPAE